MMSASKRVATLVLSCLIPVLSAGCASVPPAQRDVESRIELPGASFEAVWNGVIDLFGERHWPITNMERASGFIATDRLTVDRLERYVDCGRPSAFEGFSNHTVRFNVIVRDLEGGTSLAVNTAWSAVRTSGLDRTHQVAVTCVSTGELEREILDQVRARISS